MIGFLISMFKFCKQGYTCTCNIIIDRVAVAKQGDNALGSVRPSVRLWICVCVCLSELSCLNRLT